MNFEWKVSPETAFVDGMDKYIELTFSTLYDIMVEEAENVQTFMRRNAVWEDDCMPGREYLKAAAFQDRQLWQVGIRAYYDIELYISRCPQVMFNFGIAHETYRFAHVGIISIILPRRQNTVLGDEAPRIWDRVRALYRKG